MIPTPLHSGNVGKKQDGWKLNRRDIGNDIQMSSGSHETLPYENKRINLSKVTE